MTRCAQRVAPLVRAPLLQRREHADEREEDWDRLVEEAVSSPGRPLDPATRASMEARFHHDFGSVRIHTDATAAVSARAVRAEAYTFGRDVVFGANRYAPGTEDGRRLLLHELVHTLQPGATEVRSGRSRVSSPHDPAEREAASLSEALDEGRTIRPAAASTAVVLRQAGEAEASDPVAPACTPSPGIPDTVCGAYAASSWWLPIAYVNNATCACETTPNVPTAKCVRKRLQDKLAATPGSVKAVAALQKGNDVPGSPPYHVYQAFVQSVLTPRIYQDHVEAYRECCCPSGPASYPAWIGVTTVPLRPCSVVGYFIRQYGSCHGTPGTW